MHLKGTIQPYLKIALLIACVLSITGLYAQQQVQYTQYMYDGSLINPAFAGANEALSLTLIHRNQWSGVEGAPKSQTLSAHTLFREKQVGIGLVLSHDKIGVHESINGLFNYAYHLGLGENRFLSFGLQGGIHNRRSDYASLLEGAGNDPLVTNSAISTTYFDIGAGLYYRSSRFHVGYSVPQIIPNSIAVNDTTSVDLSKLNHLLFSRYQLSLNENFDLTPSVLLKYLYGVPLSYDLNMNLTYRQVITMGVSYRKQESVDILLNLQATPQLQIGYSYDSPIGNVSNFGAASHEIMVHYLFKYKESNVASPR